MELTPTAPGYNFDPAPPPTLEDDLDRLKAELLIISYAEINPSQARILTALILDNPPDPLTGYRIVKSSSAAKIARRCQLGETLTDETLRLFGECGIYDRQTFSFAYDKWGDRIEPHNFNATRGDYWKKETVIAIPRLPAKLPKLAKGKNAAAAVERQAKERKALADYRAQAQKIADGKVCPNCGQVHSLIVTVEATCTACGTKIDEQELGNCADARHNEPSSNFEDTPESGGYIRLDSPESGVELGDRNTEGGRRQSVDPQEFEKEFFENLEKWAGTKEVSHE